MTNQNKSNSTGPRSGNQITISQMIREFFRFQENGEMNAGLFDMGSERVNIQKRVLSNN
jgi:hypothetical protein